MVNYSTKNADELVYVLLFATGRRIGFKVYRALSLIERAVTISTWKSRLEVGA